METYMNMRLFQVMDCNEGEVLDNIIATDINMAILYWNTHGGMEFMEGADCGAWTERDWSDAEVGFDEYSLSVAPTPEELGVNVS